MKNNLFKIIALTGIALAMPVFSFSQNWIGVGGGLNNSIESMFADTINNRLYVSGEFSDPTCTTGACYSFAYWDNVSWHYVGDSAALSTRLPLTYYKGDMYSANLPKPYNSSNAYIAKLNGNSWLRTDQIGGIISKLKVINNRMYAVGAFYLMGSTTACNIAYKDSLGWHALDTTTWAFNNGFTDVAEYNGSIYVSGNFHSYDQTIWRLAKWNGTTWSNVGGTFFNHSYDAPVSLRTYKNELYVGGYFELAQGDPGNGIAKWNDTTWSQVSTGLADSFGNGGLPLDMQVINNKLIISGSFSFAGSVPAENLAEWDGTKFCGFGGKFDNAFYNFANYNNQIYVSGPTYADDTVSLNFIGRWVGGSHRDSCGNSVLNGIKKYQSSNNISVYPNPTVNEISINIKDISNYQNSAITIQNTLGQTVKKLSYTERIDVSDLAEGCYFLQINLLNGTSYKTKFIKQ